MKEGLYKAGDKKEGLQTHIHVVVSRMDLSKKIRLSPMANAKNSKNILNGKEVQIGFDRMKFVQNCEKNFDTNFNYKRAHHHKFSHYHTMKNQMRNIAKSITTSISRDESLLTEFLKISNVLNTSINLINSTDTLDALMIVFNNIPGAEECLKAIKYSYNPSKIIFDMGKNGVTKALS